MIKLIHNYVVDVSQYNYTLMIDKLKHNKDGKPVYETVGYYSSLSGAIVAAKENCIKRQFFDSTVSLEEAVQTVNQISQEFSDLLKEVLKNA